VSRLVFLLVPRDRFFRRRVRDGATSTFSEPVACLGTGEPDGFASLPIVVAVGGGLVCVEQEITSAIGFRLLNLGTVDPAVSGLSLSPSDLSGPARRTSR